ncbi:MAG: hypothetical protein ACI4XW_02745 [Candidatus Spyradocola sp.]
MKKLIILLLLLTLTAALCGCVTVQPTPAPTAIPADTPAPTAAATPEPTPAPTSEPTPDPTAAPSLQLPILSQIDENVQPGTAGSTLRAVQSAAALLDWGDATGLDPEEIETAAREWLNTLTDAQRTAFLEKLALVRDAIDQLFTDSAEELLADAGCDNTAYPWGGAPSEPVQAVLRAADLA